MIYKSDHKPDDYLQNNKTHPAQQCRHAEYAFHYSNIINTSMPVSKGPNCLPFQNDILFHLVSASFESVV